ncbi:DUF4124 domain-containing protein [Usitatibacter palustris]|uniref:DUF4124 domain-containing protein n=1 Tax=Usitatibacter palustris TaxID=2732487 RepID=A0A6M4HAP0_9PROT|nr:DUF4124 domain-containing protein [Usitatibacter palustris]QJR16869.1 hypothetical protein DSM104440_03705 [Usitatibacter palustris]
MKQLWLLGILSLASAAAVGQQSTIYKHVDASGRVTYSNKPIKDGIVVELEPITTIPSTPAGVLGQPPKPPAAPTPAPASGATVALADTKVEKSDIKPALATVKPQPSVAAASFSVDSRTQKSRDEDRRRILEDELSREEKGLTDLRKNIIVEQQNPELVAAVRLAQSTVDPTPSQQVELRKNIEKVSSRIRGLQATAAEHEKNIEALKKELGALKP